MCVSVTFVVQLVVQWSLIDGVRRQFEALREGFDLIFPLSSLTVFSPDEVSMYPFVVQSSLRVCADLFSQPASCLFDLEK